LTKSVEFTNCVTKNIILYCYRRSFLLASYEIWGNYWSRVGKNEKKIFADFHEHKKYNLSKIKIWCASRAHVNFPHIANYQFFFCRKILSELSKFQKGESFENIEKLIHVKFQLFNTFLTFFQEKIRIFQENS
jgi:hypothetical protein